MPARQACFPSPRPACGERSKPEASGEGTIRESRRLREPLTPTLSPQARGEGEDERRLSQHLFDPVVRIGGAAVLDVDQLLAESHGDRAGGAA